MIMESKSEVRKKLEELTISGISCRLPESDNMEKLSRNLFNGIEMTTEDDRRWPQGLCGLPSRNGKIGSLDHFDAAFFKVHAKQANRMDPSLRLLLELAYEAILDSGTSPNEIRGSRTGVFIGFVGNESEEAWSIDPEDINGYAKTGCHASMFANRISYSFDFTGPSFLTQAKCTSGMLALEQAVSLIRLGKCDAALVGGINLLLKPQTSVQHQRSGFLSPDGKTKAFDSDGNGYANSDGAVMIYIQKPINSRRSYASIIHIKSNMDGFKEEVTTPCAEMKAQLYQEIYTEAGINPSEVSYVEANGTGIKSEDEVELNSMTEIFCKGRDPNRPLLIGAVKSNMGHTHGASGLCSLAKALLAIRESEIPKNLSFNKPNPNIPALMDGRFKIVAENTPWEGGLIGINSFSYVGCNVHLVLRAPQERTGSTASVGSVPILIPFSGSTKESVEFGLEGISKNVSNSGFRTLLHQAFATSIPGHTFRGFGLYNPETSESQLMEVQPRPPSSQPIWFIFSGMGSQWNGMGRDLMNLKVFRNSIIKSAKILSEFGIDLIKLLNGSEDSSVPDNTVKVNQAQEAQSSFVCITSIQVALVDLLHELGIHPDGIIGHSIGETACSYADGCFTAEQAVMAAYFRGKVLMETDTPLGAMAAVGMTWEDAKRRCPADIFPACHNAPDSVTISGPVDSINNFVKELVAEGIFARAVNSSGRAFHSKYIANCGPTFKNYLSEIVPNPKPRSSRWISSSIPESEWDSPLAKTCSPAYHVNNSLNQVLFREAVAKIPENALVLEIAPHALLHPILKRSLGPTATVLGLTSRTAPRNDVHLLSAIGRIYTAGYNLDLSQLYDTVEFPVPADTPMISPLVQWNHNDSWNVPHYSMFLSGSSGSNFVKISVESQATNYEQKAFPTMGYVFLVWETFAQLLDTTYDNLPVVFENVIIHNTTFLDPSCPTKFQINILRGSGRFEIRHESSTLCSGLVRLPENIKTEFTSTHSLQFDKAELTLAEIQGNKWSNSSEIKAHGFSGNLMWDSICVAFLETLINSTYDDEQHSSNVTYIGKATIDPMELAIMKFSVPGSEDSSSSSITISKNKFINVLKSAGVELRDVAYETVPKTDPKISPHKTEITPTFQQLISNDSSFPDIQQFAGELLSGKRIMGLQKSGQSEHNSKSTWTIPDAWTLEDAVKIPSPYILAYYSLITRGDLQPSESVLIESGCSDLGQAAIAIALSLDCKVFATVQTDMQSEFLKTRFNLQNVWLEDRFEQEILERSYGEGVDLILKTSGGDTELFLKCISRNGRFIQVMGTDPENNKEVGMSVFLKNVAFHGVNPNVIYDNSHLKPIFDLVRNGIDSGTVKQLVY